MKFNKSVDNTSEEFIEVKVSQYLLLNNNLTIEDYLYLNTIRNNEYCTGKEIYEKYPALSSSERSLKRVLDVLVEEKFITRKPDKKEMNSFRYTLAPRGLGVLGLSGYTPRYSLEQYENAVEVIKHWNSFKELTTHAVKPYGEQQSKTVNNIITYVDDLLYRTEYKWTNENNFPEVTFSVDEIKKYVSKYVLKFSPDYAPTDKKNLPKSLSIFFSHYKTHHSEFFKVCYDGVSKIVTTLDELKEIGIKVPVLRKAYQVLSATGSATEAEKLEVQKNILWSYKKYKTQRDAVLDDLYSWKNVYQKKFMIYNVFLYDLLQYIDREIGKGNAKAGFISFNRGNKVFEGFSKWYIDQYNIYLLPSRKKREEILKSKIVK